ncbi:hypothetical protein ACHAPU_009046 [Fusarium lateritium]
MAQGLTTDPVNGDATIVMMGANKPARMTDFIDALMNTSEPECRIAVLGRSVVLTFVNAQTNTEDAGDIVQEFTQSGSFS